MQVYEAGLAFLLNGSIGKAVLFFIAFTICIYIYFVVMWYWMLFKNLLRTVLLYSKLSLFLIATISLGFELNDSQPVCL